MTWKERLTLPRIIAIVLLSLIPLVVTVLGLRVILTGTFITSGVLLAFFILPCCLMAGSFFLITSKTKPLVKALLMLPILVAFVLLFAEAIVIGPMISLDRYENSEAAEDYAANEKRVAAMPNLEDLGSPEAIEFYRYRYFAFVSFEWDADTLICRYAEDDYAAEKARLDERYIFQTEPMRVYGDSTLCYPTAEIDGYSFRALSVGGEYEINYPKQLMLVGTNDETQEIVYLASDDPELDYLDDLSGYILDECGWQHIRKQEVQ